MLTFFETIMKYFKILKEYYFFESYPTSYVSNVLLNISQIHKHLIFYVDRYDKLKLYKQCLDILLLALEKMKFKCNIHVDIHVVPILIETIIIVNDTLDVMCENFRLQSK